MSVELKDVDHYLSNPDELGALSDDELDALAGNSADVDKRVADAPVAENMGDTESVATPGDTGQVEDETKADGQEPEGILSVDGKHVIPYWRLADAEAKAREYASRVEELEAKISAAGAATPGQGAEAAPAAMLSDEELAAIEEDYPDVGKALRASHEQIRQLSAMVDEFQRDREKQRQDEIDEAKAEIDAEVNAAIEATPKIAHLMKHDAAGYARAVEIDMMLRKQPEWNERPLNERFSKVIEVFETLHGEIPIQTQTSQKPTDKQAVAPVGKPAPAAAKPSVPTSMSAIPGGSAPPVDEAAAVAGMSGIELTARFMNMTREQIDAELDRL